MKKIILYFLLFYFSLNNFAQNLSGQELLNKAIAYHDPNGNWNSFNGMLNITMETPENSNRDSEVQINIPEELFKLKSTRDSTTTTYYLNKGNCLISKKDSIRITQAKTKPKRSHCEMTELYKNYYTYLYGLPMKLKDPGTILNNHVKLAPFKGKDYLRLKVSYDNTVGNDIWYFYFSPNTYALEIYQFFKTDTNGNLKPNSGEYILLKGEEVINAIKMPKFRAWYYNKDDKYLGTDILN